MTKRGMAAAKEAVEDEVARLKAVISELKVISLDYRNNVAALERILVAVKQVERSAVRTAEIRRQIKDPLVFEFVNSFYVEEKVDREK